MYINCFDPYNYRMLIKLLVSQNFFWPNYFKEFKDFVRTCNKCQKAGKAGEKTLLKLVPVISEVFAKINVDASESLTCYINWKEIYYHTAMRLLSKYPDAVAVLM